MDLTKADREIQVLKSMNAILDAHIRGKRKYERRKERILSLAAIGLPVSVIAKQTGAYPSHVWYTLRRAKFDPQVFRVRKAEPMHDAKAKADR